MLRGLFTSLPTLILFLALLYVIGRTDDVDCGTSDELICHVPCDEINANLTLIPVPTYFGGDATLTLSLNENQHIDNLTYMFCYEHEPGPMKRLGCVDSNFTTASISFVWDVTGNTNAFAFAYNVTRGKNGRDHYEEIGCAVILEFDVKANKTTNVTVELSEEGRPPNKTGFYAGGNIIINASTILPESERDDGLAIQSGSGSSDDDDTGNQTIIYHFYYLANNATQTKTTTNISYVLFNDSFDAKSSQPLTIKVMANNTALNEAYHGNLTTMIDVIEKVQQPIFTVNFNKTVHKGDRVLVNFTISGGLPIIANLNISYIDNTSDHHTYNCTMEFPRNVTLDDGNSISVDCQFNRTGKFQLNAIFENNASYGSGSSNFTISNGPPPAVVASSTIAVVVVVVLLVVVILSIIVIFVYVPYQNYKNRVTETANFSFIDLQMPTRWERFKIKVQNWKDRAFRRENRLGLVNYTDVEEENILGSLYGSLNSKKS